MDNYQEVLGELRAEAARNRITQAKIAARVGRNQQWVSRRLSGEVVMHVDEFFDVCEAVGTSPVKVLNGVIRGYLPNAA